MNIIYQAGLGDLLKNGKTIDAGTWKVLLERSTSTYTPDKDDKSLLDKSGWVEISVVSYARVTITTPAITDVDGSDLVKISFDDPDFGTLEAGQTVKAAIVARDDGGNYRPLARIDTDTGGLLPRALGGGNFKLQLNASGFITFTQA